MSEITTKQAMDHLSKVLKEDPEYAYGWHSNIAMSVYDSSDGICYDHAHIIGNDAASRFMKLCFGVETSQDMLLDKDKHETNRGK